MKKNKSTTFEIIDEHIKKQIKHHYKGKLWIPINNREEIIQLLTTGALELKGKCISENGILVDDILITTNADLFSVSFKVK